MWTDQDQKNFEKEMHEPWGKNFHKAKAMEKKRYVAVTKAEFEGLLRSDKGWFWSQSGSEIVRDKLLKNGVTIRVFTSVRHDEVCRKRGDDAIRVCAFHPEQRRLGRKSRRVNRVSGWQDRVTTRVWEVFNSY
jgi:hypothetical protein